MLYHELTFKYVLYTKDVQFLSHATLKSYVACLGAEYFKFPRRVIFGGFLAEDEQKPKLVSVHPQIPKK